MENYLLNNISRRDFIKLSLTGCLALQACQSKSIFNFTTTEVVLSKIEIEIEKLPKEFQDYKIAFLSDIHLGPYFPRAWLTAALNNLTAEKYDLLLLGGDFINLPEPSLGYHLYGVLRQKEYLASKNTASSISKQIFHDCANIVAQFKPRDGVCAVKGNHDNWISSKQCTEAFEENGIRMLNNKSYKLLALMITGLDYLV
jgi:predicted MPP superfamily phosphohydrolase